jgi:hypothetical protein
VNEKRKKRLAKRMMQLESQLALDKNNKSLQAEIQEIVQSLSFKEMIELDDYICKNHKIF